MTEKERYLNCRVRRIRKLRYKINDYTAEIAALQEEIKAVMTEQDTDTLTGSDWKVTWKSVTSHSIDSKALREVLPDIAAKFTKTSTYKRFTLT